MSEFKIRTIRDTVEEPIACIIGIDKFDDIDPSDDVGLDYYCACMVLESDGSERSLPPIVSFGSQTSFRNGGFSISSKDEFGLPSPHMYDLLGQALKRKGMVYNKKKCRFQKVNS